MGYYCVDGKVGICNYWLVILLVFCENRNIEVIKVLMFEKLGYVIECEYVINID